MANREAISTYRLTGDVSTPAAGSGVSSASAILSDVQSGAGKITAAVAGDPV